MTFFEVKDDNCTLTWNWQRDWETKICYSCSDVTAHVACSRMSGGNCLKWKNIQMKHCLRRNRSNKLWSWKKPTNPRGQILYKVWVVKCLNWSSVVICILYYAVNRPTEPCSCEAGGLHHAFVFSFCRRLHTGVTPPGQTCLIARSTQSDLPPAHRLIRTQQTAKLHVTTD